jgi:hypothetical protein
LTNIENLKIGTQELKKLEPAKVKIKQVEVIEVGEKKNKKLNCLVEHKDSKELVQISSIKYETKNNKLEVIGLWINLDDEGLIRKGSALSKIIDFTKSLNIKGLEGKEIETIIDDRGYLVFKGY